MISDDDNKERWFPPRLEQNRGSGEAQRTQGAPQEWWSKCWVEEILQWPDLIIMMLTMRIYDDIIVALLVMKPETMRHSTNSWLKIGTSVLARPACKAELGNADQNPNEKRRSHQRCQCCRGQHALYRFQVRVLTYPCLLFICSNLKLKVQRGENPWIRR